tara:strand:- start:255 stop:575 length:321 start_codon:yes stop_codon:yes gene_type:complete
MKSDTDYGLVVVGNDIELDIPVYHDSISSFIIYVYSHIPRSVSSTLCLPITRDYVPIDVQSRPVTSRGDHRMDITQLVIKVRPKTSDELQESVINYFVDNLELIAS